MTEDEKQSSTEKTDKHKYAIRYGTKPDKKYWYICPRYWCLKTNEALSEEQVEQGVCKDHVHEFTDDRYHVDKDQNYKWHNQVSKEKTLILTVVYRVVMVKIGILLNWKNAEKSVVLQKTISAPEGEDMDELDMEEDDSQERMYDEPGTMPNLMYVVGPDKFPLTKSRSGFLPKSIQNLLNIDYIHVVNPNNAALLKPNTATILQAGIEQTQHQSFWLHCRYIFFLSQSYLSHSFCRRNSTNTC